MLLKKLKKKKPPINPITQRQAFLRYLCMICMYVYDYV